MTKNVVIQQSDGRFLLVSYFRDDNYTKSKHKGSNVQLNLVLYNTKDTKKKYIA